VARRHWAYCEMLGLELVSQRGFFDVVADGSIAKADRESLTSWRRTIVESGITTDEDVEALAEELKEAQTWDFQAAFSPLSVELIARVPG